MWTLRKTYAVITSVSKQKEAWSSVSGRYAGRLTDFVSFDTILAGNSACKLLIFKEVYRVKHHRGEDNLLKMYCAS